MLLMSNSLKVISMALVFCASLRRLAIFCLILFILTLCSDLVPAMALVGSAGGILTTGAAPADGLGGIGAGGGVTFLGAAGIGGTGGGVVGIGAAAAAAGEGTGTLVLSVSISQRTSSSATLSPTCFSHLTSPSEMESAKAGQTTSFTSSCNTEVVLSPRYRVSQT